MGSRGEDRFAEYVERYVCEAGQCGWYDALIP